MSFPITFKKGSDTWVGKYFQAKEFDCPCLECKDTRIDSELVKRLDRLRESLGTGLKIHHGGGYRCDFYQQDLKRRGYETAKGLSTHQMGRAVDCSAGKLSGAELEKEARKAGFRAVGVGRAFVHVDCRDDKDRRWTYSY